MPHIYVGPDSTEEEQALAMSSVLEELLVAQLRKALDNPDFAARVVEIAAEMDDNRLARALQDLGRPQQGELRECACGCGRTFVATHENHRYYDLGCGEIPELQPDGSLVIYIGKRPTH